MGSAMIIFTLLGGVLLSAQSSINGKFSQKAGTIESTLLTFFTGMLFLALLILFFGQGDILKILEVPKWQLSAVLFGVSYLFLTILAVPRIGVTAANISTVIGQLAASMIIDHFGLFGGMQINFGYKRWIALVLMLLALYFVFKGKKKQSRQ
ncbi:DMT family transporter [Metabacillus sp. GX 13764]|uniref:DMT family transporter n=1 Tax=Metabacillus kandeliae TaxID=2900151 RepID=UPI001E56A286|nr:DMT family transporter [Metabacillus kandeliae]MCD7036355.1 DMT family transporter [Metabacillus kandeliae]